MRDMSTCQMPKPKKWRVILIAFFGAISLTACQTNPEPVEGPLTAQLAGTSAVTTLQRINERALNCWIKSGDADFKNYALVPELDTRTSDPRILIVERGKAQGLPRLVISASGQPVKLVTFGPLTQSSLSARINSDVLAWGAGRKTCNDTA